MLYEVITVLVCPLQQGFMLRGAGMALVAEAELLGQKVIQRRRRDRQKGGASGDAIIRNLAELSIGQPVVHLEHGVGRYLGLQTIDAGGLATEYLTLEYANQDKLYVPVTSLHLISRYSGGEHPPLHKLGTDAFV